MVDFRCTGYSDGRVVVDKTNAQAELSSFGLGKPARENGIHSDTVAVIAKGNPVKPITLAKAGRITQLSTLAFLARPGDFPLETESQSRIVQRVRRRI